MEFQAARYQNVMFIVGMSGNRPRSGDRAQAGSSEERDRQDWAYRSDVYRGGPGRREYLHLPEPGDCQARSSEQYGGAVNAAALVPALKIANRGC